MAHLADQLFIESPLNAEFTIRNQTPTLTWRPQREAVCIYAASHWNWQAPLRNSNWEVWALNLVAPWIQPTEGENIERLLRADRWFDLHQREAQSPDDMRWIAKCPCPIYLPPDLMDASPNAVRFPLEELEDEFGISYWSCTFAYQIALAMHLGFKAIGMYGVELGQGTARERTVEWACTWYWLGRAQERGIQIEMPTESCLMQHAGRYGFEYRAELAAVKTYTDNMKRSMQPDETPHVPSLNNS